MRNFIFILLILLNFSSTTNSVTVPEELLDLISFIQKEKLTLEQWEWTVQEKVTEEQAMEFLQKLGKENKIKKTETNDITTYQQSFSLSTPSMSLTISVVIPQNKQYSPKVTVQIQGVNWDETVMKGLSEEKFEDILKNFSQNARIFTCLVVTSNDIINDVYFTGVLTDKLQMKNVVVQSDTIEQSTYHDIIYGYVPLWNNSVHVLDQRFNMQIVMQNDNDLKTKMIIGTPILMNEY